MRNPHVITPQPKPAILTLRQNRGAADVAPDDPTSQFSLLGKSETLADVTSRHAALAAEGDGAAGRLADARQRVAVAWGWYRDRDSLRAQIAEWEDDAAARTQYAKDYRSLVHGRNAERYAEALYLQRRGRDDELEERMGEWRRKKLLSVGEEATMRVALALFVLARRYGTFPAALDGQDPFAKQFVHFRNCLSRRDVADYVP